MPSEYYTAIGVTCLFMVVAASLRVKWVLIRDKQPVHDFRPAWDSPLIAAFLLLVSIGFCILPPGDWHRLIPFGFSIACFLLAPLLTRDKQKKTSTSTKDTSWNS